MRLAIDARVWKTGLGTYTLNLLPAIRRQDGRIRIKAIVPAEAVEAVSGWSDETQIVEAPIYSVQEQLQIPGAARGCDLLHVPHYNIPLAYRGPLVATIHDLTHVTEPALRNTAKAWLYARPMLKAVARKALRIITVSEFSRRQIVERVRAEPWKVSTIYNGVGPQFRPMDRASAAMRVRMELQIEQPFLLFVGNLKPHKNVTALLRAFALLRSRRQAEPLLLLVGDDRKGRQTILNECARLGLGKAIRHVPWVSEELLPCVYAAAELVVMPSTSEGFGLPVLEAMACGTPAACSKVTSLPEVGGDAAVYFDPYNVEEMAGAIERVIDSPSLQAELREKGLKQAAKFTWDECARKHLEIYRKVLNA